MSTRATHQNSMKKLLWNAELSTEHCSTVKSLFRRLLRLAPSPELKSFVKRDFRRNSKLRNFQRIQLKLSEGEKLLDDFQKIKTGESSLLSKYDHVNTFLLASKPDILKSSPPASPRKPVRTPGIIFANAFHPPLPRLKPQPDHITMMTFDRRRAIQRRWDRYNAAGDLLFDCSAEEEFEKRLGLETGPWGEGTRKMMRDSEVAFQREDARGKLRPSPQLLAKASAAHRRRTSTNAKHGKDSAS
ncbi:hypothetical protein T439DRAFT_323965 [Meredithblackwellia eburnea MCA 4105]